MSDGINKISDACFALARTAKKKSGELYKKPQVQKIWRLNETRSGAKHVIVIKEPACF